MPILPVLGHKPITSYFSRTSSTKRKRKEINKPESSSTEGISKRPKQSASSSFPSRHSFRDKVDSPCTPLGTPGKQSLDGTLLTCMAPFRSRIGSEKGPSSSLQRLEPSCQQDKPEAMSFPAPSHRLSSGANRQPSETLASNVTNATMQGLIIPSSQSQDSPSMEVDILASFEEISRKFSLRSTGGEDLIIESSQSQLLIVASPNVRKLELEPTLPAFDVVIPSSQSQEKELTVPTDKEIETGARGRSLVWTAHMEIEIPQQTLSDDLFSVPIRDSILDNLFSDEQALDIPAPWDNPDSGNLAESETEDEQERNLEPTSWCPAARASSISQSSLGIGSYSSLPPEVWEFRKMFENGDESYPADFPESLRS